MIGWRNDPFFVTWPFLEKLAGNQLSKIIGFVPIAGYLILFNDGLAEVMSFDRIAGVTKETQSVFLVSSVTKLRLTFFGSLFLLLANLGFRFWSPNALQATKNDLEFSDRVLSSYSFRELKQLELEVVSQTLLRTPLIAESSRYSSFFQQKNKIQRRNESLNRARFLFGLEDYMAVLAREWWAAQMHGHTKIRIVVFVLSTIGYSMLAVPSADIAQAVLRDLF